MFKIDGKFFSKETIAKTCMLVANLMNNKKKQFVILDHVTHDIMARGTK